MTEITPIINSLIPKLAQLKGLFTINSIGGIRTTLVNEDCISGDCPLLALAKKAVQDNPSILTEYGRALKKASALLSQEITSSPDGWRNSDALVLGIVILQAMPMEVSELIIAADQVKPFNVELRNQLTLVLGLN